MYKTNYKSLLLVIPVFLSIQYSLPFSPPLFLFPFLSSFSSSLPPYISFLRSASPDTYRKTLLPTTNHVFTQIDGTGAARSTRSLSRSRTKGCAEFAVRWTRTSGWTKKNRAKRECSRNKWSNNATIHPPSAPSICAGRCVLSFSSSLLLRYRLFSAYWRAAIAVYCWRHINRTIM